MPPPHFLLLGSRGMLARAWQGLLTAHAIPFDAFDLPDIDITDPATLDRPDLTPPTHVVNCAAWTDVDAAESNEDAAHAINAQGAANVAAWSAARGARLIHYSTDYVFPGDAREPYLTDHPIDPIGAYGRTKAAGERLVAAAPDALIIRTSWLYAPWGKNFPRTIARLALQNPTLNVVNDQRARPTSAEHLARISLALTLGDQSGIWHVTDADDCTWFDVASEIVTWLGADCRIRPCTSAEFPRPARRPAYSTLDISKTESLLGPMPHWRTNLHDTLRRMNITD